MNSTVCVRVEWVQSALVESGLSGPSGSVRSSQEIVNRSRYINGDFVRAARR